VGEDQPLSSSRISAQLPKSCHPIDWNDEKMAAACSCARLATQNLSLGTHLATISLDTRSSLSGRRFGDFLESGSVYHIYFTGISQRNALISEHLRLSSDLTEGLKYIWNSLTLTANCTN
jgi:hypothetical protein